MTTEPHTVRLGALVVGCATIAATCFGWAATEIKDARRNRGPVRIPAELADHHPRTLR